MVVSRSTGSRRDGIRVNEVVAWARRLPWDTRTALGICGVALLLRLLPLGAFSSEYDEGVYWQSLRAMAHGHPLYSQVFSSQPPLFLLAIYPFYILFGQSLGAARLGIALFSLIGIGALYVAGRAIGGRWAGLLAAALLAVDPLYLRQSYTLQAEAPALALGTLCVALAVEAARRADGVPRRRLALASGVALGLGVLIKLFIVVALLPAAIYLAGPVFAALCDAEGALHLPTRAVVADRLRAVLPDLGWFALGAVGACLVVLLPFAPRWGDLAAQVFAFHFRAARATSGGLRFHLGIITGAETWLPLALPGLAALALVVWRRVWALLPPLVWALASFVLLLRQQPLFAHHVVLLSPPLALAGGLALVLAAREVEAGRVRLPRWGELAVVRTAALGVVVAALGVGLARGAVALSAAGQYVPVAQLRMAVALQATTPPGDTVITDDPYVAALADRDVPPQLVDTSSVRIASGYLTARQLEQVIIRTDARTILFASGRFGTIPGFPAWIAPRFQRAATFGDGRALYLKLPQGPTVV
ncbi:MAG: glycosyltransferase family 39 protein [Ktedonobacterales bacterium]|nr:glycosyltransferase family 39 protein [Ktedonobacterales bacterium]